MLKNSQAAQKGPDARRRPTAAREAYFLYVERKAEGANEAYGPFSAACEPTPHIVLEFQVKDEPAVDPSHDLSTQDTGGPLDASLVYGPHLVAESAGVFGETAFFGAKDRLHPAFRRPSLYGRQGDDGDCPGEFVGDLA